MGNDSHQAVPACQPRQGFYGLAEGLLVEGAKAFVHKHGVQADAASRRLDLVRKPQRQTEGGLEGFASGQGADASLCAIVVVDDIQLQAALAAVIPRFTAPLQLVLSARHGQKTQIGPPDNAVEIGGLDVGLQHNLFLSGDIAAGCVGKGPHPGQALLQLLLLFQTKLHIFKS